MGTAFPERLRSTRDSIGESQDEFSKRIGVSRASLSYYENGTRTPDIDVLKRIYETTGVSIYYLLGLSDSLDDSFATAQKKTGLSNESLCILEKDESARYFVERILCSKERSDLIQQILRYQIDTCFDLQDRIAGKDTSWVRAKAQAVHSAKAADALRKVFLSNSKNDKPPMIWAYSFGKDNKQEDLNEEINIAFSAYRGIYAENLFYENTDNILKEDTDAPQTPEQ